mgnify:FL=1
MTRILHALNLSAAIRLLVIGSALIVTGCSTVPAAGPTGGALRSQIENDEAMMAIDLVPVKNMADVPAGQSRVAVFAQDYAPPPPTEMVGPGDELEITVFETGVSLFGGPAPVGGGLGGPQGQSALGVAPSARSQQVPPYRVGDDGLINFPFIGKLKVAGRTTDEIEALIVQRLRGKSQNPQVLVSISAGLTNSVIIGGDVRSPGRIVLPTNRETVSDVVALAGGSTGDIKDLLVRIQRDGDYGEFRLSDILATPEQDVRVFPSDRILLVRAPQTFSALGAAGRGDQFEFPAPSVSLAEAVAMAGGANAAAGDPRAIFVFRLVEGSDGEKKPTVFHFNMLEASSYILAQRFEMRDDDVLYIGEAEANRPSRVVQVLSQLFFPLVTLQATLNNGNN